MHLEQNPESAAGLEEDISQNDVNVLLSPTATNAKMHLEQNPKSAAKLKREIGQNDVIIAVMGVTGVGKSSFINLIVDEEVPVGHGLQSHTSKVGVYTTNWNNTTLHLIDTPGFDDTDKPDAEVLEEISTFLGETYEKGIKLAGIIYLHRITDPRLQGSAMKNLHMLKKLCGADQLANVVLATTRWDEVQNAVGLRREKELCDTDAFWGGMIKNNSKVFQHTNDSQSARKLVSYLIDKKKSVVLEIQRDLVDKKLSLIETEAGKEVMAEFARVTARMERELNRTEKAREEAMKARDSQHAEELQKVKAELESEMKRRQQDTERLQNDLSALRLSQQNEAREATTTTRRIPARRSNTIVRGNTNWADARERIPILPGRGGAGRGRLRQSNIAHCWVDRGWYWGSKGRNWVGWDWVNGGWFPCDNGRCVADGGWFWHNSDTCRWNYQ